MKNKAVFFLFLLFSLYSLQPLLFSEEARVTQESDYLDKSITNPTSSRHQFSFYGEFLYWVAREESLEYDFLGNLQNIGVRGNISMQEPDFSWGPGFRVNAGYCISDYSWNVSAGWTRYHRSDFGDSFDPLSGQNHFEVWSDGNTWGATSNTNPVTEKWKLGFDLLQAGLSCPLSLGKRLTVPLEFGGAGVWIDQELFVSYPKNLIVTTNTVDSITAHFKNNYHAGGLFAGTSPKLRIYKNFYLVSGFYSFFLQGVFRVEQKWFREETSRTDLAFSKALSRSRFALNAKLGLQWNTELIEKYDLSFSAQYEGFIWFRQNLLSQTMTIFVNDIERQGDLQMQGVSFCGSINF